MHCVSVDVERLVVKIASKVTKTVSGEVLMSLTYYFVCLLSCVWIWFQSGILCVWTVSESQEDLVREIASGSEIMPAVKHYEQKAFCGMFEYSKDDELTVIKRLIIGWQSLILLCHAETQKYAQTNEHWHSRSVSRFVHQGIVEHAETCKVACLYMSLHCELEKRPFIPRCLFKYLWIVCSYCFYRFCCTEIFFWFIFSTHLLQNVYVCYHSAQYFYSCLSSQDSDGFH